MLDMLKGIYGGKKVFLTGHTGFKGSWMLKLLNMLGAEVKGYALAPKTEGDHFYLIHGDEICTSVIGDLRDIKKLVDEMKDFAPDFVFHLAAQPLVRSSYRNPIETFEVNSIGTAAVLEGLRAIDNSCLAVMITTDKVYHNNEWNYFYREVDGLGGYDPYSASKACAELIIDSYRNSYFNPKDYNFHHKSISVTRAGNVIGGGDWSEDRLIPDIMKSISVGKDILIRNPNAVRPWQHVIEPVVAYLILGGKMVQDPIAYAQAYNIGPYMGDSLPVIDIVKLAIQEWGQGSYVVQQDQNQPHEAGLLKLDISKVVAELGWKPKWTSQEAIEMTVRWYKAFFGKESDMDKVTEDQILHFLNKDVEHE
jgi:CDP-glucose 4,6-dehydratase